jgi:hypothetical protein
MKDLLFRQHKNFFPGCQAGRDYFPASGEVVGQGKNSGGGVPNSEPMAPGFFL